MEPEGLRAGRPVQGSRRRRDLAGGGTLPQAGFTPAEEVNMCGAPGAPAPGGIDHLVAGENMFHIDVREKEPLLPQ